ncbi:hypothetical protein [Arthrobacter sp. H5]|uniref:hypothetical protein n=1 Tax=Arthrobacter sp. H5 TaxID=1267973 RepID=UPI000487CE01|nr:hypothetical protein [Arthrobacter sp. H5]
MGETIVVLTEESLNETDVRNLVSLSGDQSAQFLVLIPEDRHKNILGEFFHHLSLFEFADAFRELSHGQPSAEESRVSADAALAASLEAAASAGLTAHGRVVGDNAVAAMVDAVSELAAGQAVVVTRPHAVADTFHTDWANQAQDKLGIPVLHLYSGSGFIGDS